MKQVYQSFQKILKISQFQVPKLIKQYRFTQFTKPQHQQFQNKIQFQFSEQQQIKQSDVSGNGFFMQQFYTACLSEYAYYIESNGEALVIDPLRDVQPYIDLAKSRGVNIKYVLLTHFHADFVAGHHSLRRAGAKVVMGPNGNASYVDHVMQDNEQINLGNIKIKALHTPGHTLESTCYLLIDKENNQHSIYTGDTLFLGEVGRPDLAVKGDITSQDLAGMLYDSIQKHIKPLNDDITIYPGHGAGSACGKNISTGYSCKIGNQKKNNYALQPMKREEFIAIVSSNLPVPPQYFLYNVGLNKSENVEDSQQIYQNAQNGLSPQQVKQYLDAGVLLLDTRTDISNGYIKGGINISAKMAVASWVGQLFKPDIQIILLTDEGQEQETIIRLARIGYDNIIGYLDGGIQSWIDSKLEIIQPSLMKPEEFIQNYKKGGSYLLDVRTKNEWSQGVIEGAHLIQLSELEKYLQEIPIDKQIYVYCAQGLRAKIALTMLAKQGITNVTSCTVGYNILKQMI